jgi:hypothetical protein
MPLIIAIDIAIIDTPLTLRHAIDDTPPLRH